MDVFIFVDSEVIGDFDYEEDDDEGDGDDDDESNDEENDEKKGINNSAFLNLYLLLCYIQIFICI